MKFFAALLSLSVVLISTSLLINKIQITPTKAPVIHNDYRAETAKIQAKLRLHAAIKSPQDAIKEAASVKALSDETQKHNINRQTLQHIEAQINRLEQEINTNKYIEKANNNFANANERSRLYALLRARDIFFEQKVQLLLKEM